jgi:hypothetical protein
MFKKDKLDKNGCMFKSEDGDLLIKKAGEVNGQQFIIKDLANCDVVILDHTA